MCSSDLARFVVVLLGDCVTDRHLLITCDAGANARSAKFNGVKLVFELRWDHLIHSTYILSVVEHGLPTSSCKIFWI